MDEDLQVLETSAPTLPTLPPHLTDITLTATSPAVSAPRPTSNGNGVAANQFPPGQSKYAQLLAVIEEMGRDIRPTYAGSKSSAEKLKRGIVQARILVRECLMETERSARQ